MNQEQNNILGLQPQDSNTISKPQESNQFSNVNFETVNAKSSFEQDSDQTRSTALENHIAGIPLVDTKIKVAEQKPDLSKESITNSFTTRDEIMSKLGMMDENYNYTDTYTNYINKGGAPLPGYEWAHQELLNQERYDSIFQKVEDGTLSYDTALMEAYGKDIMATMGYDVTSVAYWQNKFLNNDFSNPFSNQYLMDQVKAAAEEYHQSRLAGEYAHRDMASTTAAGLVGQEVSAEKIRDIFTNLDEYAEEQNLTDQELRKQITSGQIGATARLIPADDTGSSYYYLHTDGQMYILDNKEGNNHGKFQLDEDGNIKEISLNSGEIIDGVRHFAAGAASVFTGLAKIAALATSGVEAIFTDQSYMDALTGELAAIDSFLNDTEALNWLTDTGHVDVDGFQMDDASDWIFAVCDIGGMIAGGYALGSVSGLLSKGGTAMQTASIGGKTVQLSSFAQAKSLGFKAAAKYATGSTLKATGNMLARSTGMYSGAKGFDNSVFHAFGKDFTKVGIGKLSLSAPAVNHMLKTVPTYMVKDFYSTVQTLNNARVQAVVNGDTTTISDGDIYNKAITITLINGAISSVFAGGINDNQVQRLGIQTKTMKQASNTLQKVSQKLRSKGLKETQENLLKTLTSSELKTFLTARRQTIAINSSMDLFDNFLTMNLQDALMTTKTVDGKTDVISFKEAWTSYTDDAGQHKGAFWSPENFVRNAMSAVIMTAPTVKGNLGTEGYNIPLQELGAINKNILSTFDIEIAKQSDANNKQTLELVKQAYVSDYMSHKGSTEEKILYAMDNLSKNLGGKKVPKIVTDAVGKVVSAEKNAFYSQLYAETTAKHLAHRQAIADVYQQTLNTNKGFIKNLLSGAVSKISGYTTGIEHISDLKAATSREGMANLQDMETRSALMAAEIDKQITPVLKAFEEATQTRVSNEIISKLKYDPSEVNFDKAVKFHSLDDLKMDDQLKDDIQSKIESPESYVYVRIKNEAGFAGNAKFSDRMKANIFRTSLDMLSGEDNSLFVKVNDEYYAMPMLSSAVSQAYTLDATYKYNLALMEISKGNKTEGISLMMSTFLGDHDYDNEENYNLAGREITKMLEIAATNNVIDDIDAVQTLHEMLHGENPNPKVRKALKAFKANTELAMKNATSNSSLTPLERNYKTLEAIKTLNEMMSANKKIFTSDKQQAALDLLLQDGKPSEEVMTFIKAYNAKYGDKVNIEDFTAKLTELAKERESGVNPNSSGNVDQILTRILSHTNGAFTDEELDTLANTYVSGKGKKKLASQLKTVMKAADDIYKTSEQRKMSDNIVVLNYSYNFGKETYNARNKFRVEAAQKQDNTLAKMNLYTAAITNEFKKQAEANPNNFGMQVFDISNGFERQEFVAKARMLGIFDADVPLNSQAEVQTALRSSINDHVKEGISYTAGKQFTLKVDGVDMDKVAEEILKVIPEVKHQEYLVDSIDNNVKKVDIVTQIKNAIKYENLSPEMIARFQPRGKKLSIIPFLHKDKYDMKSIVDVMFETDERATKQGTLGGKNRDAYKQSAIESMTAAVETDPELSKYFAVRNIIEEITSTPTMFQFTVSSKFKNKLIEMQIIGDRGFYDYTETGVDSIKLSLKKDIKDAMLYYIEGNDNINLFKIIPMISDIQPREVANYYRHPMVSDGKLTFNGEETYIPDMYNGNAGIHQGIDTLMNIEFGWDPNGTLKNELFFNLSKQAMSGNFEYKPFNKMDDPISKLTSLYESEMNAMLGVKDGHKVEDYRVWLKEEKFLQRLNDAYMKGTLDSITVKDILDLYPPAKNVGRKTSYGELSYNPVYYARGGYTTGLQMSGDILVRAADYEFVPYDSTGKLYQGAELDIERAIEEFKNNVSLYEDYKVLTASDAYTTRVFQENWVTKLLQNVGGSNGYFLIEDADYINKITEQEFSKIFDGTRVTPKEASKIYNGLKEVAKGFANFQNKVQDLRSIEGIRQGATASVAIDKTTGIVDPTRPEYKEDVQTLNDIFTNKDAIVGEHEYHKKLSDVAYAGANEFSNDLFNNLFNQRDREARDKFATPANLEILDLQEYAGMRTEKGIIENTVANLKSFASDNNINRLDENKLIKLAKDLYVSAAGTEKFMSEYEGYKLIDDDMNLISSITKARNPFEVYNVLLNTDLKGKTFLRLNKHDLKSVDGITFDYLKINTDKDAENLRLAFLRDGIDAMFPKFRNQYANKGQYLAWLESLDDNTFAEVVKEQTRTTLSKRTQQDIIARSIHSMQPNIQVDKVREVLIPKVFGNPSFNNEGIQNYLKAKGAAEESTDPYIVAQAELADWGDKSYSLLTKTHKQALSNINALYNKKLNISDEDFIKGVEELCNATTDEQMIHIGKLKDAGYSAKEIINGYIINSKKANAIAYKTITDLNIKDLANEETQSLQLRTFDNKKLPLTVVRDILNKQNKDQKLIVFDIEGESKKAIKKYTPDEMFQIAIKVYDSTDKAPTTQTYFILHKDLKGNIIDPKDWVEKNVNKEDKNSFYNRTPAYRKALEQYASYSTENKYNFITEDQLKDLFDENNIVMAYNGTNYDFKMVENLIGKNTLVDAMELQSIMYPGDNPFDRVNQETTLYKTGFLDTTESKKTAHDAGNDVDALSRYIEGTVPAITDQGLKTKQYLVRFIDKVADSFGADKNSLYKSTDKFFNDRELKGLATEQSKFDQRLVDASDSAQIKRYLNFMIQDDLGFLLTNFERNEIYKQLGISDVVKDMINNKTYKTVASNIAHIMTAYNKNASDAFYDLVKAAFDRLPEGEKFRVKALDILSKEDLLDDFEATFDSSDPIYLHNKNALERSLSKGLRGNNDEKYGLNAKDIKEYELRGSLDSFLYGMSDAHKQMTLHEDIKNLLIARSLAPTSATDESLYNKPQQLVIQNKAAKRLVDLLDNYTDVDDLLVTKVDGIYKMLAPLNPEGESYTEILPAKTTKGWKASKHLIDIDPSEIVLTRKAAETIYKTSVDKIFDENGEAWCYSLAYPSDKQNHLMAHKLRIVEGNDIRIFATPQVMESLRARDFDGDFMTVFAASTPEQREIAKISTKYLFRAQALQEKLYKQTDSFKGAGSSTFLDAMRIAGSPDIINKCMDLDKAISIGKGIEEAEDALRIAISINLLTLDTNSTVDDLYKYIGLSKDKGKFNHIMNPYIYRQDGTFSKDTMLKWLASNASTKSNLVDSTYGYFKKWKMNKLTNDYEITNPLSQLNSTDIQITGSLLDGIEKIKDTKDILSMTSIMKDHIELCRTDLKDADFDSDMKVILSSIEDFESEIKAVDIDTSKYLLAELTNSVMTGIEYSIRRNKTFNEEVMNVLNNTDLDHTFKDQLDHKLELAEIKKLSDSIKSPIHKAPMETETMEQSILVSKWLEDVNARTGKEFVDDMSQLLKTNTGKVAVMLDDFGAEDTVYINKNTNMKQFFISDFNIGRDYKVDSIPNKIATMTGPITLTASEANDFIKGANFKNDVEILDVVYKNDDGKTKVIAIRAAELIPIGTQKVLFGGKGKEKILTPGSKNTVEFDALISQKIFKQEKLSMHTPFDINNREVQTIWVTEKKNGKTVQVPKRVIVLENVPNYLVMDDSQFSNNGQRIEYMAWCGSNESLPGIGIYGNTMYKKQGGGFYHTDENVKPIFADRDNKFGIVYSNAVQQIQAVRTDILGQIMTKYNLWTNKDKAKWFDDSINSYEDLIAEVTHNPYIATEEFQHQLNGIKNFIISAIGKNKFESEIASRSDIEKAHFSPMIERMFAKFSQGNLYKYTDKDGEIMRITTKNKQKEQVAPLASEGLVETANKATKDILTSNVRDMESYYIPFNEYYKILTGRTLRDRDIIDGTAKGVLSHRTHLAGESSIDGGFKPVDSIYSIDIEEGMPAKMYMNNLKNGMGGTVDYQRTNTINGMKYFDRRIEESLLYQENLPSNRSLYDALYRNIDSTNRSPGYDSSYAYMAYNLYNMFDRRNTTDVDRAIATVTRNVDPEVAMIVLKNTWTTEDGETKYTAKPFVTKDTFPNLTDNGRDELNLSLNKYNYYTHSEVYNKYDVSDATDKKKALKGMNNKPPKGIDQDILKDVLNTVTSKYDKVTNRETYAVRGFNNNIKFTFDAKQTNEVFKDSLWTGSGIKIEGEDTMAINVALKNYGAYAEYAKVETSQALANLNKVVRKVNMKDFQDYCIYNCIEASKSISPETAKLRAEYAGYNEADIYGLPAKAKDFERRHGDVAVAYNNYISSMTKLVKQAEAATGETFGNVVSILAPFKSTDKITNYNTVYNTIKSHLDFNDYDPTINIKSNMVFNFFDSANSMMNQLSKLIGVQQISNTLKNQKLLDNVSIVDKVYGFLTENIDASKMYLKADDPAYIQANEDIMSVLSTYTDIPITKVTKGCKTAGEKFQRLYDVLNAKAAESRDSIMDATGEYVTLSSAKLGMENTTDTILKKMYADAYNNMWAQVIVAQRILEISPRAMRNATSFVTDIQKQGYSLCNKYGQRIAIDSPIRPLAESSTKFIADNVELYYNNSNPEKFAQYVVEKALSGELYLAKADLVQQLEDKVYTQKVPSRLMSKLMDFSKISSSLQMSMPTKMLSRLARFTAFDYIMGAIYNPNSVRYAPQAAKEIYQAVHTKGQEMTDELREYFKREGQPIGVQGKDAVTFSEDINSKVSNITDILSSPLQVQNHLGRYAIYKAALESFKKGDPWYGPTYMHKNQIDSLQSNEDKAMFVMDYMLGSPGGFPYLSKKTSGLMMYSTFPLNLTRTMGAWGMSVGRLANEGFTSENAKHWMRNVVSPSVGVLAMTAAANMFISYICELYGVDEETEEEWKDKGVWIDPLGTILGDSPSVVYDSVIPTKNLKEMFIEPFTSKYNETTGEKLYGLLQANILSRLNPAIKSPLEVLTRKDMFGASAYDTSNQYTYGENAIRKTLGFFVGAGVANNVVNQYKIDEYNDDSNFMSSLWKGISKGISADLGNQKSWKKQSSNYYAAINSVRNFYNSTNAGDFYDAETEDLIDPNYMEYQRNSSGKYGEYNKDDFSRVNAMVRNMIKSKEASSTVYAYIVEEYNNGTSEATLRAVLNNNSIIRKLSKVDKSAFYGTLSSKELQMIAQAIEFEEDMYPLLQEFFPSTSSYSGSRYLPKRTKYYGGGGSNYYSPTYPKRYYPSFVYPSNNSYYSKYRSYSPYANIDRVSVRVSPEMAVWKNDYNAIDDLEKREWYLDNPFYNSLSDYEKRQKGGN